MEPMDWPISHSQAQCVENTSLNSVIAFWQFSNAQWKIKLMRRVLLDGANICQSICGFNVYITKYMYKSIYQDRLGEELCKELKWNQQTLFLLKKHAKLIYCQLWWFCPMRWVEIYSKLLIHFDNQRIRRKLHISVTLSMAGTRELVSPNATYMRQWTWSVLLQVMACCLFGAMPLPEPILTYC